jgi:hypothetical protein
MERYHLECLGTLQVKGREDYKNKKALLLLAYVVLEPRPQGYSSRTLGTLAAKFFSDSKNPEAGLSNAKWSLNQQLDTTPKDSDIVTRNYQAQGVDTDIELLLAACDKGVGELETIKQLFYKGRCFEGLEHDDNLSEELQTWLHAWREKIEQRVWEVLLTAASQAPDAHLIIEEAYEATQTFPEHDLDYCHALLKLGGSYLTDVVVARFELEPLSLQEAERLLEERGDSAAVLPNPIKKPIASESTLINKEFSEVKANDLTPDEITASEVTEPHEDSSPLEPVSEPKPEKKGTDAKAEKTSSSESSEKPHLVDLNALLKHIKNILLRFTKVS